MSSPEPAGTSPMRISADDFRALAAARLAQRATPRRQALPASSRKQAWQRPVLSGGPVRIALPFLPPSVNQLFSTVRDPATGATKRVLTGKARKVRKLILAMIHGALDPTKIYQLTIDVYLKAWTRAGRVRRVDLTNRVKFLEDCVCGALGIDDSHVFRVLLQKHDSVEERTVIEITAIDSRTTRDKP